MATKIDGAPAIAMVVIHPSTRRVHLEAGFFCCAYSLVRRAVMVLGTVLPHHFFPDMRYCNGNIELS